MASIFKTAGGSDVELAGVGRMAGNGKGGIPVSLAAEHVHELQDEHGEPLTGSTLTSAAKKFADARGLEVETAAKDFDAEQLRVEGGAFPKGLTIEEIASAAVERDRAQVAQHEPALTTAEVPIQESAILPPLSFPKES